MKKTEGYKWEIIPDIPKSRKVKQITNFNNGVICLTEKGEMFFYETQKKKKWYKFWN